jgi:hypothetical protein
MTKTRARRASSRSHQHPRSALWQSQTFATLLDTRDGGMLSTSERSPMPHSLKLICFTDRSHGQGVGFGRTIITYSNSSGGFEAPKLRR